MTQASTTPAQPEKLTRSGFLRRWLGGLSLALVAGLAGATSWKSKRKTQVWQLDPHKCVHCGNCEHACVLKPSAVKAVHAYVLCGYCKLCGGYHH
ncbi:MAG: hypothetical protein ABR497_03260, partial [Kiritimatiellia bacterium]